MALSCIPRVQEARYKSLNFLKKNFAAFLSGTWSAIDFPGMKRKELLSSDTNITKQHSRQQLTYLTTGRNTTPFTLGTLKI